MRKRLVFLILLLVLATSVSSQKVVDSAVLTSLNNNDKTKVIVVMKKDPGPLELSQEGDNYEIIDGWTGEVNIQDLNKLLNNPDVLSVQADWKLKQLRFDSEEIINATLLQNITVGGFNITGVNQTICLIDSGVDYTHDEFGNCTTAEYQNGTCDGGKFIPGYDFVNYDNDPWDDDNHGTFITGIIRAIAPDTKIIHNKACDNFGDCYASAIISSIDHCMNNRSEYNMNVVSISIGDETGHTDDNCFPSDSLAMAINNAHTQGVFFSVASGNDHLNTGINYPACVGGSTSVGATSKSDDISDYTNTYTTLDLLAPGTAINSTVKGDTTAFSQGTSFSAPMVSAGAALLRQYSNDTWSNTEIETKLKVGGVPINDSIKGGIWPRIDLFGALTAGTECYVETDCGSDGYITDSICFDDKLKRNYTDYSCNEGYCESNTSFIDYQDCGNGCIDGQSICRASGGGGGGGPRLYECKITANSEWQAGRTVNMTIEYYDSYGGLKDPDDGIAMSVYDENSEKVYRSALSDYRVSEGRYVFTYLPDEEFIGEYSVECYGRQRSTEVVGYKSVEIVEIGSGLRTLSVSGDDFGRGTIRLVDSVMLGLKGILNRILEQFRNVGNAITGN